MSYLALLLAASLQVPQDTPPPMPPGMMPQDTAHVRMLRQQVEQRFGQVVQTQLQLNESQMQQLRAAMRAHQERRRDLNQRFMAVNQAIRGQMQPGVAANQDSLAKLLEAQSRLRVERVEQENQLERELTFLDPVERVRFMQMLRRFDDQVQEIVRRRQGMMGPMGPGGGMRRPWPPRMGPRP